MLQSASTSTVVPSPSFSPIRKKATLKSMNSKSILNIVASPKGRNKPCKANCDVEAGIQSLSDATLLSKSRQVQKVDGTAPIRRIPPLEKGVVDEETSTTSLSDPYVEPMLSTKGSRTRKRKRDDSPIADKFQDPCLSHSSNVRKESLQDQIVDDWSISAGPTRRSGRKKEVAVQSLPSKASENKVH